jgi:hypothetical protein
MTGLSVAMFPSNKFVPVRTSFSTRRYLYDCYDPLNSCERSDIRRGCGYRAQMSRENVGTGF